VLSYIEGVKRVKDIIKDIDIQNAAGNLETSVGGIAADSRKVKRGDLFFALPGLHVNGHDFIPDALNRGAAGIVHSSDFDIPAAVSVKTRNVPQALSKAASAFWDYPSRRIPVLGVTGTDGKSSTAYFLSQLLESTGVKSGFITTALIKAGEEETKNNYRQTTLDAPDVNQLLAEMIHKDKQCAVIEASSHGLSFRTARLKDIRFTGAVLTNITHEHLEFHGTFDNYRHDKANLFRSLDSAAPIDPAIPFSERKPFGIVNAGSTHAEYFKAATAHRVYTYGVETAGADYAAIDVKPDIEGTTFRLAAPELDKPQQLRLYIPGLYNVENLLAALSAASQFTSYPVYRFFPAVQNLKSIPGRMMKIGKGLPFTVIIDYAHSPASFRKLFCMLKPYTKGKLIAVFGSAGERDREKRPLQGKIAAEFCSLIILTDEDPRGEDSMKIIEEIAAGCAGTSAEIKKIPDRKQAITYAVSAAEPGDTVLLLGKGHESSIIYPDGPIEWNEITAAATALKESGYQ
jgi:UDP-N-acetylmuramoyl-L-alanyl-D-glutamate--2,6-diaminopimelate ligase